MTWWLTSRIFNILKFNVKNIFQLKSQVLDGDHLSIRIIFVSWLWKKTCVCRWNWVILNLEGKLKTTISQSQTSFVLFCFILLLVDCYLAEENDQLCLIYVVIMWETLPTLVIDNDIQLFRLDPVVTHTESRIYKIRQIFVFMWD